MNPIHPRSNNMNRHYGRIYFATEFAIAQADRTINSKGHPVPKENADYSKGYQAVIWDKDGKGALWSNEMPKMDLDTTPADAFVRLHAEAMRLAPKVGPIDLYAHGAGTEITQTVG